MNREVLSETLLTLGDVSLSVGVVLGALAAALALALLRRRSDAGPALRALADGQREANRRLALVDDTSRRVAEVARVLSDKQTRGAFAERHMEGIVADALPRGLYAFQATLANGTRPDCVVRAAKGARALVIDAKFPLEAWTAWRDAADDRARNAAATRLRRDVGAHVEAVATKYLTRETLPLAFIFVPSEALFADVHAEFEEIVAAAQGRRVVLVSPSLLWCAVQVVAHVTRDARLHADPMLGEHADALAHETNEIDAALGKLARVHDEMGAALDRARRSGAKASREAGALAKAAPRMRRAV